MDKKEKKNKKEIKENDNNNNNSSSNNNRIRKAERKRKINAWLEKHKFLKWIYTHTIITILVLWLIGLATALITRAIIINKEKKQEPEKISLVDRKKVIQNNNNSTDITAPMNNYGELELIGVYNTITTQQGQEYKYNLANENISINTYKRDNINNTETTRKYIDKIGSKSYLITIQKPTTAEITTLVFKYNKKDNYSDMIPDLYTYFNIYTTDNNTLNNLNYIDDLTYNLKVLDQDKSEQTSYNYNCTNLTTQDLSQYGDNVERNIYFIFSFTTITNLPSINYTFSATLNRTQDIGNGDDENGTKMVYTQLQQMNEYYLKGYENNDNDQVIYNSGYDDGYFDGINNEENNKTNYDNGYNKGYDKGYKDGLNDEENNKKNYDKGEDVGYNRGYQEGKDSEQDPNYLGSALVATVDAPFYMLFKFFNFEILGLNVFSILMSLLSVLIIGFVIKLFI